MISSEQDDLLGVFDFVAEQQLYGFDGVVASINEISDKDVAVGRQLSSYFEQFQDIEELTMDISTYGYWGLGFMYVALLE